MGFIIMERLHFNPQNTATNLLEMAVHIARYQMAKPYIAGKRVLDIACGEGYGSWLLKEWGAASVIGVDRNEEAIHHARQLYTRDDVVFISENAEQLDLEKKFDVIVSMETFEHIADQNSYLLQLKRHLISNGVLIISCPNDHWYYNNEESNPFHVRKYTFNEFVLESEAILGKARSWFIGTNCFGYASLSYDSESHTVQYSKSLLPHTDLYFSSDASDINIHQNTSNTFLTADQGLYYVGIWGGIENLIFNHSSSATFPIQPLRENIFELEKNNLILKKYNVELEASRLELEASRLKLEARLNELKSSIKKLSLTLIALIINNMKNYVTRKKILKYFRTSSN